jgi:predicted NBD/HSP70 family sugar kinase
MCRNILDAQAKYKEAAVGSLTTREIELLRLVHAEPGITRAQAAETLSASSGTITGLVQSLGSAGLLDERPATPSGSRGRPTRRLVAHPSGPLVIAGVVSHGSSRLSVVELGGTTVASESARHDGASGEQVVRELGRRAAALASRFPGRIRGTGLGFPGVVRGTVLVDAPLLGWRALHVEDVAPAPAGAWAAGTSPLLVVGNDATCAALGEAVRGAARDAELHLHVYLDAGLGGALTHRGAVVPGALGLGGEFGHMPFGDPDAACPCGATGCWITAVGSFPLAQALGEPVPADPVDYARRVLDRALGGEIRAIHAVTTMTTRLGRGIAGLVNGLDVDLVTLGGWAPGVARVAPDALADAYLGGLMRFRRAEAPPIIAGRLGDDAPIAGASEQVWTRLWAAL